VVKRIAAGSARQVTSELNTKLAQYLFPTSPPVERVRTQIEVKAAFCVGERAAADLVRLLKKGNRLTGSCQKRSGRKPCQATANNDDLRCGTHMFVLLPLSRLSGGKGYNWG
jgi:hypothetical protein